MGSIPTFPTIFSILLKIKFPHPKIQKFPYICTMKNSEPKSLCISVHLLSQSQAIEYDGCKNSYTKDGLFCVYTSENIVHKYPMVNIFRIIENYV